MDLYEEICNYIDEDVKATEGKENCIRVVEKDNASITVYDKQDGEGRYMTIRNPRYIDRSYIEFLVRVSDSVSKLPYTVTATKLANYLERDVDKNMLTSVQRIVLVTGDETEKDSLFKDTMLLQCKKEGMRFPTTKEISGRWPHDDVVVVNMKGIIEKVEEYARHHSITTEEYMKFLNAGVAKSVLKEVRRCVQDNIYLPETVFNTIDNDPGRDAYFYANNWYDGHPAEIVQDKTLDKTKLSSIPNKWVYDVEVFAKDWMVVAYQPEEKRFVEFHNDSYGLNKWLREERPFLIGFNNKHYDDYILLGMIRGNSNDMIKDHNDFIIEGKTIAEDGAEYNNLAWEHYSVNNMRTKDYFYSMDVASDIPKGMSLKRIQGNFGEDIVESPIPFDIPRKLTPEEVAIVLKYCRNDVEATYRLMERRKTYFETKLDIADMGGIRPVEALGLTNAKLVAKYLKARTLKEPNIGEFEYTLPDCIQLGKHGEQLLDFYMGFKEDSEKRNLYGKSCTISINDLDLRIGWGGIHGAKENYSGETTEKQKIVDIDVGSYYPSIILQFGYLSQAMSKDGRKRYQDVYNDRMKNKREGKTGKAGAQKLVLNTAFGCTKNRFNPMYHPQTANNICITGQLLLIDLMEKLDKTVSFDLIQANTDGIIFSYDVSEEKQIRKIVSDWEKRTGMNMEYTEIKKLVQKDVNNYVMISGETYTVKNGRKVHLKDDKNKEVRKGGWTNQKPEEEGVVIFPIIKEAICKKLLYDIPVEKTIQECDDIFQFQMVAQPIRGAKGAVAYRNGVGTDVQKVNRIYASKDTANEKVYWTTSLGINGSVVTECPDHAVVDNDNHLTMKDIDKDWYIQVANERVQGFLEERKKVKKKKASMADLFAETTENTPENVPKK